MTSSQPVLELKSAPPANRSGGGFLFLIQITIYLLVSGLLFCGLALLIFPDQQERLILYLSGGTAVLFFLILLSSRLSAFSSVDRRDLQRKAQIYATLLPQNLVGQSVEEQMKLLMLGRQTALEYSQELVNDYKKVRRTCRNLYYILQLSTIILSSVTPILVLVDKQINVPYVQWIPVICPAIAAIVTSIATSSFPFKPAGPKPTRW
jgi:hypothetical protein